MRDGIHRVVATGDNWEPEGLRFAWWCPYFTDKGGIGGLGSLYEAGNNIAAIGEVKDDCTFVFGSGVMIAPGLLLTATHVLNDLPTNTMPLIFTFPSQGAIRVWRGFQTSTLKGPGLFVPFGDVGRSIHSDLTLMSCVLVSDAYAEHPMMFVVLEMGLPLRGERLWAVGFRQGDLSVSPTRVAPLLSSGLVTACYPHGRGNRMPSPCLEVEMPTEGGMSGGPVLNSKGHVVGIVSSSLDTPESLGPTYVTLAWDAMRMSINVPWPRRRWPMGDVDLFKARELEYVEIVGDIQQDANSVRLILSEEAVQFLGPKPRDHGL
jgi:Trypsin-like peptidase domain